ncbi:MAG: hypothetical protein KGH53_03500 [Candidatus Micrarchaeota archaeon]|nr:hypothetical protein [Candidatus Micrarchaeota archaeon]
MIGVALNIIKLLVVLIVVAGAVVAVTYLSAPSTAAPANLGAASSAAVLALKNTHLYQTLSTNKVVTLSSLVPAQNASQNYNLSYSGTVTYAAVVSGVSVPITFPIALTNQRFGNDSRIVLALSKIPLISNLNLSLVKLGSKLYTCAPTNIFSKNLTYACSQSTSASPNALGLFYLAGTGLNLTINNFYPTLQGTTPCIYMNSTFGIAGTNARNSLGSLSSVGGAVNTGSISSINGTLQSCLQSPSNLPLTLNIAVAVRQTNSTTNIKVALIQVTNNTAVSDSAIRALPGNVVN